jgi:hypothetical protein
LGVEEYWWRRASVSSFLVSANFGPVPVDASEAR